MNTQKERGEKETDRKKLIKIGEIVRCERRGMKERQKQKEKDRCERRKKKRDENGSQTRNIERETVDEREIEK